MTTIRETEAAFRAEGYSRREAEEMAAVLNTKKHEVNDMPKTLLETRKEQLAKLEDAFDKLRWIKNRNEQQEDQTDSEGDSFHGSTSLPYI